MMKGKKEKKMNMHNVSLEMNDLTPFNTYPKYKGEQADLVI